MIEVNIIAILIALVANFIFGFLWYTPLFGKAWAKEMHMDTTQRPPTSVFVRGLLFMAIGNFLMAYVFAHNIAAWSFVPDMADTPKMTNVMMSAFFTWLGFFLPGDLSRVAWEKHSWKLFMINTVYHLISLVIAALILINMPVKA